MFPIDETPYLNLSESDSEVGDDWLFRTAPTPRVRARRTPRRRRTVARAPHEIVCDNMPPGMADTAARALRTESCDARITGKLPRRRRRRRKRATTGATDQPMYIGWSLFVKAKWAEHGERYEREGKSVADVAKELSPIWHHMKQTGEHMLYHNRGFELQRKRRELRSLSEASK